MVGIGAIVSLQVVIMDLMSDEGLPVALWAIGMLCFLTGLLITISRVFRYRYSGTFQTPWVRGIGLMLLGLGSISAAIWLLGVRDGLRVFWTYTLFLVIVIAVADVYRRTRS